MLTAKTAKGVSAKSLELYIVVFVCRLLSILRHQGNFARPVPSRVSLMFVIGYLPFDKSGDWFYHVVEIISFISVSFATYLLFLPLMSTYDEKYDKFGNLHIPDRLGALYLLGPCVLMALIFHPYVPTHCFLSFSPSPLPSILLLQFSQ
jgi:ER lumen protein retaining receptor